MNGTFSQGCDGTANNPFCVLPHIELYTAIIGLIQKRLDSNKTNDAIYFIYKGKYMSLRIENTSAFTTRWKVAIKDLVWAHFGNIIAMKPYQSTKIFSNTVVITMLEPLPENVVA